MKRILCYGDSNTWGFVPATGIRYPADVRWTKIVQKILGSEYEIIEEGLSGRTTVWEDGVREYMNGIAYLGPCLVSHYPLDAVVVMLGTNDLKRRFHLDAWTVGEGIRCLVDRIKKCSSDHFESGMPKILLVSPIYIADEIDASPYALEFDGRMTCEISHQLAGHISRIADETGCYFMDAADYASASRTDSIHMEPEGHRALGVEIARKIKEILG